MTLSKVDLIVSEAVITDKKWSNLWCNIMKLQTQISMQRNDCPSTTILFSFFLLLTNKVRRICRLPTAVIYMSCDKFVNELDL